MPIKRENRGNYPVDWHALARAIKVANGWQCQECGRVCRDPHNRADSDPLDRSEIAQFTLTISHYFHDYRAEAIFVACLCAPCHIRHDAQAHAQARRLNRRLRRLQSGQMSLFACGPEAIQQHARTATATDVAELERHWVEWSYLETLTLTGEPGHGLEVTP